MHYHTCHVVRPNTQLIDPIRTHLMKHFFNYISEFHAHCNLFVDLLGYFDVTPHVPNTIACQQHEVGLVADGLLVHHRVHYHQLLLARDVFVRFLVEVAHRTRECQLAVDAAV